MYRSGIVKSTKTLMNYKQITLNTFLWQKGTSKVEDFKKLFIARKCLQYEDMFKIFQMTFSEKKCIRFGARNSLNTYLC